MALPASAFLTQTGYLKGCGSHAILIYLALRQIQASRKMNQREPTYTSLALLLDTVLLSDPQTLELWA